MNRQLPLFFVCVTVTWSVLNATSTGQSALRPGEARVTRVHNRVQLLRNNSAPQRASVNEIVNQKTLVRTGKGSHAELTFPDETAVRLAANTGFSFQNGTNHLNVSEGAVLVQAPKSATGATIHAAGVAAAITGSTAMIEFHPGICKFLVLEGTGRLFRPGHLGDSVLVGPGQMVIGNPNAPLSDPATFDIARFVKTSRLITDFAPLRSEKTISVESQKQQQQKSKKTLTETNLVIFGGGTRVSLVDQTGTTKYPTPNPSPETARASR